jgi:hypothetical protein
MVDVISDRGWETNLMTSPYNGLESTVGGLPVDVQSDLISTNNFTFTLQVTDEVNMALYVRPETLKRAVRIGMTPSDYRTTDQRKGWFSVPSVGSRSIRSCNGI